MMAVVFQALVHLLFIRKNIPDAKNGYFSVDQAIVRAHFQKEFNQYVDESKDKFDVDIAIEEVDSIAKDRMQGYIIFGSIFLVLFSSIFGVYFDHALKLAKVKTGLELNVTFLMYTLLALAIAYLAFTFRNVSYIVSSFKRIQILKALLQHYKNEYNL